MKETKAKKRGIKHSAPPVEPRPPYLRHAQHLADQLLSKTRSNQMELFDGITRRLSPETRRKAIEYHVNVLGFDLTRAQQRGFEAALAVLTREGYRSKKLRLTLDLVQMIRRASAALRCAVHGGFSCWARKAALPIWSFGSCVDARGGHIGGNVLDFVAAMENCSLRDAAAKISQWFGSTIRKRPAPPLATQQPGQAGDEASNPVLRFVLHGIDPTHPYLADRGITAETAAAFGIGFYGYEGIMRGRIVIPIENDAGELVA